MNLEKKSFLLYLDNWEAVQALNVEQRGWLLTVVYEYAMALGRVDAPDVWTFLERYPDMEDMTRVACAFICATIARDTRKWLAQQESRQKKALERQHTQPNSRAKEDMERTQRLLLQM